MIHRLLLILAFISFVYVALTPFDWQPPRVVENGAEFTKDKTLRFSEPGIVETPRAFEWMPSAIDSCQFTIQLSLRSFSSSQQGPARIFTVSRDELARNITVGQSQKDLVVRLRRGNNFNGLPAFKITNALEDQDWHHIEILIKPASLKINMDGKTVLVSPRETCCLMHWNPRFGVALGNEFTGDRPWLGELSQVVVTVGKKEWNYLTFENIEIPDTYYSGMQRDFFLPLSGSKHRNKAFKDVSLNFLCFIPVGYLLARTKQDTSVLFALVVCAATSLSVELAQLCFHNRFTSFVDLAANTMGGGFGAFLAKYLMWRRIGV